MYEAMLNNRPLMYVGCDLDVSNGTCLSKLKTNDLVIVIDSNNQPITENGESMKLIIMSNERYTG